MFALKDAKTQTKAGGDSVGKLMSSRPVHPPRSSRKSADGNRQDADAAALLSRDLWNFRDISVFPPAGSGSTQRLLPDVGRADLPVGAIDDPREREASVIAERALAFGNSHALLDQGISRARLHTGRQAETAAAALDAAAFTIGDNIFFGAGQYRPDQRSGQRLIAHEAVHVAQQARSGRAMVQRQPVQMPPLEVTSSLEPTERAVPNLNRLTNVGVTPQTPTLSRPQAVIELNAPDPATRLPFTSNGWDANEILQKLGQYDRMPGTDSDALRCVQAVGMAARVPDGPDAVTAYLASLSLQGMQTGQLTDRKRTALRVLKYVSNRIDMQRATYGDLAWAQEAMHDLFYDDVSGTPLTDIPTQVKPDLDLTKSMQSMDVWCDTPQQVMAEAAKLKNGEQLLIEEWTVTLNTTFDQLSEQGIEVREGDSTLVNVNGREVRIRRIPTDRRPPHTALDFNRDTRAGHQLLIIKDSASGALRLYEPEITGTGRHFDGLAANGSNLTSYFNDQPRFGIYHYIEIIGKLQPGLTGPSAFNP